MRRMIERFIVWYLKRHNVTFEYNNYVVRTKWTADKSAFSDRYILFKITNVMMTDINQ